jgi:hypothetical protein
MKYMNSNLRIHYFVRSILSWKWIIGQCLAALNSHISTLEPDQADSTLHGEYYIPCLRFSADISREMRNKPQHSEQVDCHILAPKGD